MRHIGLATGVERFQKGPAPRAIGIKLCIVAGHRRQQRPRAVFAIQIAIAIAAIGQQRGIVNQRETAVQRLVVKIIVTAAPTPLI